MTLAFFFAEIIIGYATNALSLVADSFHMLSDVIALIVGLLAVRYTKKRTSNAKYSYGYFRAEVAGALCNSVFLIGLCFTILVEAIQRFVETDSMREPKLVLIIGAAGLLINLVGLVLFSGALFTCGSSEENYDVGHGHSHGSGANMNLKGVALHLLGDALGSVIVMISSGIIWWTFSKYDGCECVEEDGFNDIDFSNITPGTCCSGKISACPKWPQYIDPSLSIIITIIILYSTVPLFLKSLKIVLQVSPTEVSKTDVERAL